MTRTIFKRGHLARSANIIGYTAAVLMCTLTPSVYAKQSHASCERAVTQWSDKSGVGYYTAQADVRALSTASAVDQMRAQMIEKTAKITLYSPATGRISGELDYTKYSGYPPFYDFYVIRLGGSTHLRLVYSRSLQGNPESLAETKRSICKMLKAIKTDSVVSQK
jgi:hypothetical protein